MRNIKWHPGAQYQKGLAGMMNRAETKKESLGKAGKPGQKAAQKDAGEPKIRTKHNSILRRTLRGMKYILLSMTVLVMVSAIALGIWFYARYGKQLLSYQTRANSLVAQSTKETFRASQTSLVYAAGGELISRLKGEKDVYYISYKDIPEYAVQAMICTEDRKFFEHGGVDLLANIRAAIVLVKNKGEIHQGGSTITQQLARAVFLTNEVTWERKLTEIFTAMALERKYSKTQIMEFYLNNIYFANGYYGIQAASMGYFGKSVKELSLSQIAFVCAIPNNPTDYDPVTNFDYTMLRRDKVLVQMRDEGAISEAEYQQALAEKITLERKKSEIQDYVESYTYYCAIRALMAKEGFVFRNSFSDDADREGYEERYYDAYYRIQKTLFTGGYRIYTSFDLRKQEMLQQAVDEGLAGFTETNEAGTYKLQGSAACIDNRTGRIVAIVGGRSQEREGYTLNRAYQSFRQPGSAIKPLIVYTPMFERGMYPDDLVMDERFEGGPRNSGGVYSGEIPLSYAIAASKNTVAWKLFEELTPHVGLSYLLKMGFRRIVDTDYVPAASLGGFTYGVSAVELAGGYAALCNDGMYREPTCIVKITDAQGNVVVGDVAEPERVYAVNAARMMTACLQGVMESGTGRKLKVTGQVAAGKTGTTNDQKDGWFAGYTAYYTTAVWVGCDMPKAMDDLMGNTYPGRIWQAFMNRLHEGVAAKEFVAYVDLRPPKEETEEGELGEAGEETGNGEVGEESQAGDGTGNGEADEPGQDGDGAGNGKADEPDQDGDEAGNGKADEPGQDGDEAGDGKTDEPDQDGDEAGSGKTDELGQDGDEAGDGETDEPDQDGDEAGDGETDEPGQDGDGTGDGETGEPNQNGNTTGNTVAGKPVQDGKSTANPPDGENSQNPDAGDGETTGKPTGNGGRPTGGTDGGKPTDATSQGGAAQIGGQGTEAGDGGKRTGE